MKEESLSLVNENVSFKVYVIIRRLVDILLSLMGMVFLIPITIVVKIATMLSGDFDSIFFVQDRIGKDGKTFKLYKFRSMCKNADAILEDWLKNNKEIAEEYNINKKLKDDPRITKVGNILRKTSIDELPQLINIFIGDMSLIGPRPYLPREKKDMGKSYKTIIKMVPGLTGYWQVNGRSDTTFKYRLKLDEEYYKIRSLKTDIKILFKTVSVVLLKKGAE